MLVKLKAVVLGQVKYGDNARILRCFTNLYGQQSYLVQGLHRKNAAVRPSMLQPLSLLELEAYHRGKGQLERIKEARWLYPYETIPLDPARTAQALFLAEVMQRIFKAEEAHEAFFDQLSVWLQQWDQSATPQPDFHLLLLARTAAELGFEPTPMQQESWFDLAEGQYSSEKPLHNQALDPLVALQWNALFHGEAPQLNHKSRNHLLDALLDYFRLHLEQFGTIKSLDVVREVMR